MLLYKYVILQNQMIELINMIKEIGKLELLMGTGIILIIMIYTIIPNNKHPNNAILSVIIMLEILVLIVAIEIFTLKI